MTADVVQLCFHGIGVPRRDLERGEAPYWISVSAFHSVLDTVAGDPRVRLSFDDGNASDLDIAVPALLERGLWATFFVLAGRLDRRGSLSRDSVRELASHGMGVGLHGMDHVSWRGLDPASAHRELVEARSLLAEAVGRPVEEAALPLGRYDRGTLALLHREGYRAVHSSDRAVADRDGWLRPRFSVRHGDDGASLSREVLAAARPARRLRDRAVGAAKRWR